MTTKKQTHRPLVSLKLPRPIPALILIAKQMVQSMTNNPSFPNPIPPLATVTEATTALEVAQAAAQARTHGAATLRNERRTALVSLLEQLKTYVQKTADSNLEAAGSIIESAGVNLRKPTTRAKRVFAAKHGATSGTVKVVTQSAGPRSSYEWQYSLDGAKTWTPMPSTIQASTTLTGMTPGAVVTFRYRVVNKAGEGNWELPTSITVQ
jgi:hypothetical protein